MTQEAIRLGLARQLEIRRSLLAGGRRRLGWKAGFGAPAALAKFGLDGPLIGFMTDDSRIAGPVEISGWTRPVAEPELAIYLAQDLPRAADQADVRQAVGAIGAAIELADIDQPPEDIEQILVGNIYHRGVLLGAPDTTRSGAELTGLRAVVRRNGAELSEAEDLEALTGRILDVVAHMSSLLAEHGVELAAGDVVICGSVVPPIELSRGDTIEFELQPLEAITAQVL